MGTVPSYPLGNQIIDIPSAVWQVEGHEQFGWGLVRATRLRKLLLGGEWNWCGLVAFYLIVTILGLTVVILINITGLVAGAINVGQWATVFLGLPGIFTFLRVLSQVPTSVSSLSHVHRYIACIFVTIRHSR